MPLPRLTPRELRNLRIHGGLTQHIPKPMKRMEKAQAPTAPNAGSAPARKGGGRKTPLAKSAPLAKGPGKNFSATHGNRRPGTRLVKPDLFDPGVIGKVLAMNSSRRKMAQADKKGAITFDTSDAKYIGYMRLLRIEIESIWKYPRQAAYRGEQGDLEIRFTINKKGQLADVQVLRGSGYPLLDEAAVQALKNGRYWPLPDSWHQTKLTIDGHFVYSLRGAATQLW